jgi:hypothetical protein
VQRGHRDAAQLGLGDIQAQVGADVDQPPGLARQEVTGVVATRTGSLPARCWPSPGGQRKPDHCATTAPKSRERVAPGLMLAAVADYGAAVSAAGIPAITGFGVPS